MESIYFSIIFSILLHLNLLTKYFASAISEHVSIYFHQVVCCFFNTLSGIVSFRWYLDWYTDKCSRVYIARNNNQKKTLSSREIFMTKKHILFYGSQDGWITFSENKMLFTMTCKSKVHYIFYLLFGTIIYFEH